MMISPAGAEGINLNNVRQVHILEPYWNEVRIEQKITAIENQEKVFLDKIVAKYGEGTFDINTGIFSSKQS